jgi:hypothetical protein
MAYMSQERKKELEPTIKKLLKEYGVKGSISVRNLSALVVTISSGSIDFNLGERTYEQVNTYLIDRYYEGLAREFLLKLRDLMNSGNWNNSNAQSDYWDVGWHIDINIGTWKHPYQLVSEQAVV